jgi:hypothetical protein
MKLILGDRMLARKEQEMTNSQASIHLDKTEEDFVVELKTKSAQELHHFLAGPWTASILSPEAMEELYWYQKKQQKEETPQHRTALKH